MKKLLKSVSIRESIQAVLDDYFASLNAECLPTNLHKTVLEEIEKPLIESVMKLCQNNQTKASSVLGLNRSTLKKKLIAYNLLKL